MGILDTAAEIFRFSRQQNVNFTTASTGIASSFTSTLETLVGPSAGLVLAGEAQALTVPPVSRAAQLYATGASKMVLKNDLGEVPPYLRPGTGALTPGGAVAAMVLSLFFHGKAVCFLGRDDAGNVTSILPLPPNHFGLDLFGQITLKGTVIADQSKFVFVRSLLGQGFLDFGADAITHYIGLRDSILSRSRNPIPVVELKLTDNFTASEKEIKDAQTAWQVARSATNGAVALTPAGIDVVIHGDKADTNMLSEARNEVRKDVANFANVNSSLLEGNNGQSDTYSNTLQDKDEFVDLSLDTFLVPIEQRFSQLDLSPSGPLTFDRATFRNAVAPAAQGNAGAAVEDSKPSDQEDTE